MASLKSEVPTVTLNNGATIPMIAYGTGTAMFKDVDDHKVDPERVKQIKTAISSGYRHLDGAEVYNTERELGVAIKDSKVPREELFVTTKTLVTGSISESLETSLKKLQLDYVDLFLIHNPWIQKPLKEAWKEMKALKSAGKAKAIGVSNFLIPHLEEILDGASEAPAVNQIEYNLYLQRRDLYDFNQKHGIVIEAFGPLSPVAKAAGGPADPMLASLAKKYGVSTAEICMRWCIEKGAVVVTTSSKEQRLSDYMRTTAFKLTPKEVEDLSEVSAEKHHRQYFTDKFGADDRT